MFIIIIAEDSKIKIDNKRMTDCGKIQSVIMNPIKIVVLQSIFHKINPLITDHDYRRVHITSGSDTDYFNSN